MSNLTIKFVAVGLLAIMLGLAYFSMLDDSAIMDEVAHLPAGYSYVTQLDMRLNPEHPPLIKDLAGLSVLTWSKISGTPINFPDGIKAWQEDVNGQWDFGFDFLYKEGNDTNKMLSWGRLPMLLILLALGIFIFVWTKKLWGKRAGLLALFFFSFSPTFLAHGRFVTTDVAAAAAFFISSFYFIRWLRRPGAWNLILAAIFFGLAQLAKFSLFLLIPLFGFLTLCWIIIKIFGRSDAANEEKKESSLKIIWRYIAGLVLIFTVGYALIVTPVYYFHIKNYPVQKQLLDMRHILKSYGGGPDQEALASCKNFDLARIKRCPAEITIWMAEKPAPLRAFSQYLFGLLMVVQRAAGGNTTYFMGEVSAAGWSLYFPIVYLLKEPLVLHILTIAAVLIALSRIFKKQNKPIQTKAGFAKRFASWLDLNFESFAMLVFIALYWYTSITSPLNIGVRHVLPTFPFIFALVSSQVTGWLRKKPNQKKLLSSFKYLAVFLLLFWQAITVIAIYPSFLAYFNEIVGGPKNGYKYVVDSNLDWGQDLLRLKQWVEQNKIEKIYVDYFGGGDAKYYLDDKFQPWWGTRRPSDLKSGDYLAVSATLLQGGRGNPVPGFTQDHNYYNWLNQYEPKAVIGYSIFVYQIP